MNYFSIIDCNIWTGIRIITSVHIFQYIMLDKKEFVFKNDALNKYINMIDYRMIIKINEILLLLLLLLFNLHIYIYIYIYTSI